MRKWFATNDFAISGHLYGRIEIEFQHNGTIVIWTGDIPGAGTWFNLPCTKLNISTLVR